MEPDKENKNDINTTVNDLRDAGIDIVEGSRDSESNEFFQGAAPQLGPAQQQPQPRPANPTPAAAPIGTNPVPGGSPAFIDQNRPSAQSIIDGVLGIGNVRKPVGEITKNDPSIKPLRTFKSDAEEAVKYNNVSKINIAVAEQKRREEAPQVTPGATPIEYSKEGGPSKLLIVLFVILILIAAGGGAYYWFFMQPTTSTPIKTVNVPKGLVIKTAIPYSSADTVTLIGGRDPLPLIADKLANANLPIGQVFALLPLPEGTTTTMATTAMLFSGTHMPDRLVRSLNNDYTIGTYFYSSNNPFIILKNTFFANAFAGMLDWEKDMRNDLVSLIRVTSPEEPPISTDNYSFSDKVISNTDARVLKNTDGKIILAYAFVDKNTIVISTNTDALKYILDKLLVVRVVQ